MTDDSVPASDTTKQAVEVPVELVEALRGIVSSLIARGINVATWDLLRISDALGRLDAEAAPPAA